MQHDVQTDPRFICPGSSCSYIQQIVLSHKCSNEILQQLENWVMNKFVFGQQLWDFWTGVFKHPQMYLVQLLILTL